MDNKNTYSANELTADELIETKIISLNSEKGQLNYLISNKESFQISGTGLKLFQLNSV